MTTLTKHQTKSFVKSFQVDGVIHNIVAEVRHDDKCGNGHNTFSITGTIHRNGRWDRGGCIHEDIAEHFPELAPLLKWHLTSTDGPLHYVANTVYHADQHGATHAWVYYTGAADPLGIGGNGERLLGYEKADLAQSVEGQPGYRVEWDQKTVKVANLDYARSSAVWPEATDEDLTAPGLKERLEARLPSLLAAFRTAVESLGFTF